MAGATTTMITGTLASQFALPGNYTALIVSFILGLMVWNDTSINIFKRALFYVVNSVIIFTMAMGFNAAGVAASKTEQQITRSVPQEDSVFFNDWF